MIQIICLVFPSDSKTWNPCDPKLRLAVTSELKPNHHHVRHDLSTFPDFLNLGWIPLDGCNCWIPGFLRWEFTGDSMLFSCRTCPRSGGTAAATNGYGNSGGNRDAGLQKREAIVCCHGNLRVPPLCHVYPQEIRPY